MSTPTKTAKGGGAKKGDGKSKRAEGGKYTKPELREKIRKEVVAGDKGGRPGQWSARKAQLVAHEYKAEGGGYKEGGKTDSQKHLDQWTDEKWKTADGKKAIQGKKTARYLPAEAWEKLSPAERKATNARKIEGSKTGKQFIPNTEKAKSARRKVTASSGAKAAKSDAGGTSKRAQSKAPVSTKKKGPESASTRRGATKPAKASSPAKKPGKSKNSRASAKKKA